MNVKKLFLKVKQQIFMISIFLKNINISTEYNPIYKLVGRSNIYF